MIIFIGEPLSENILVNMLLCISLVIMKLFHFYILLFTNFILFIKAILACDNRVPYLCDFSIAGPNSSYCELFIYYLINIPYFSSYGIKEYV